nr:hypothetical protein [Tanacetum cinerariifolium]
SQDFSKGSVDPTLFIRRNGKDLLLMSMMGKISFFLGLQISQSPRGIFINQLKYALESLKKYGFESCDPVDTPTMEKSKLDEDKKGKVVDPSHYRAFADADHTGCQDIRRSTSCSLQFLGERLISWSSKRQKSATISSMEAEYIALSGQCISTSDITLSRSRTMDMTIDQQVALYEALVPHASRLWIGKSNFCLRSDISSKESTLQLATATVHHHSIWFKMDNKKRIVNVKYFRDMMHICPRLPGQTFDDLPFEKGILEFLRFLRHSEEIKKLTDFKVISGTDPLGLYHKKNVDFAYLLWEDFIYQVKHKDAKKSNEMYYPRFIKVIIYYFMTKDPSIPRRNKVNWHYVRDNQMFTMMKLVSRHQNIQQFGVMLPIELTNKEIRNSEAYKEYYAVASGAAPPKTKASVRKTKSSSNTTVTPPTATVGTRLSTFAKYKQPAKASKAKSLNVLSEVAMTEAEQLKLATKRSLQQTHISQASGLGTDEGTDIILGVLDVPTEESDEEISWKLNDEEDDDDVDEGSDDQDDNDDDQDDDNQDDDVQDERDDDDDQDEGNDDDQDSNEEGKEFIHPKLSIHDEEETKDEERFDPIAKTPKNSDDEGNDDENLGLDVGREEGHDAEDDEDELYRHVNINLEGKVVQMADVHTTQEFEDTHVTLTLTTSQMDVQAPTTVASLTLSTPTLTPSTIATISTVPQAPTPLATALSTLLQDLPNFGSLFGFNHQLKTLEANFSAFVQINQFAGVISSILEIVQRYMDQRMNEAVKVAVQIQSDRLHDEAQAENEEFLKNHNENIQKIIKEQVKEQVKVQVSKILLKIEKIVNEQLEAGVLTRSSNSSKTSYAVAADLLEMELKKILIEKMEGNKSIPRSDEQRNLYKALVEAYEFDKIIVDTFEDIVTLKRRRNDDADKDEEPSAGSDLGSKRRREGKEPESTSPPKEKATKITGSELAKQADSRSSFNELMDTLVDFSAFLMNRLKVDTLTPELLAGPTYELMKGSCKSLVELEFFLEEVYKATTDQLDWNNHEGQQYPHNLLKPLPLIPNSQGRQVISFDHFINNDLEYLRGGASSRKYKTLVTKTKAAYYGYIKWTDDLVPRTMESAQDVYSKRRIIVITELQIVEWHNYKHLDWIMNVHKKHRNPKECGRPSTRCRKLPKEAQPHKAGCNKDKQNRLKRIDELHKFSDGTLNDVRTALDDRLKGIQMKYLPHTIWRKSDKERAASMIQANDKQLKIRRIMRSLERFVGGRIYEGDFRMLQRII